MNYYPHHIGDFNGATRHLTLVERALYRELLDIYYDTEKPIPADDLDKLARRVCAKTDQEKAALKEVLSEFFILENGVYHHTRCDAEILIYQEKIEKASQAGKASALARAKRKSNKRSTSVQQTLNGHSTHQSPIPLTNNQDKTLVGAAPNGALHASEIILTMPLNNGSEFPIYKSFISELEPLYPAVDVPQTLKEMKGWLIGNPTRRKTRTGVRKFITSWLQKEQEKHGS